MVDAKDIKQLNLLLENDSPPALVRGLEIFVALLRNKANTKPVDVELFFKDHGKLVSKMSKTETTSVDLDLAIASKQELDGLRKCFGYEGRTEHEAQTNGNDLSPYSPFIEWSINFCEAAMIDLKLAKLESEVEEFKLKIERA